MSSPPHPTARAPWRRPAFIAALLACLGAVAVPAAADDYVVTHEPGAPAARTPGVGPSTPPAAAAAAFLQRNRARSGLTRAGARVRALRATALPGGSRAVRFRQEVDGVPVLGAEQVVTVRPDGRVGSASGSRLEGDTPDLHPRVDGRTAARTAVAAVARARGMAVVELRAGRPELVLFDPSLFGAPGLPGARLVWQTVVSSRDGDVRVRGLVDARRGAVAAMVDLNPHGLHREVCDADLQPAQVPCIDPVRGEGQPESTEHHEDVTAAYEHAGDFHAFFRDVVGRDSVDGLGMSLKQTVRYCDTTDPGCDPAVAGSRPYANAFWNGDQAVFGQGWATADVVAHEFTHGVTEHTAGLFYWYQSGAINESMSDIFGELAQQWAGGAAPSDTWLIGEDTPGGAIRDMADPGRFDHPDRTSSPDYHGDGTDAGGVHVNSGVGNRAAHLMAEGGTLNGEEVVGIGLVPTARIHYRALAGFLRSGSDYRHLAEALPAACEALASEGGADVSAGDCDQVRAAVRATEMDETPVNAALPAAPACEPGAVRGTAVFEDDMEDVSSGRWTQRTIAGGQPVWGYASQYPYGWNTVYATSGTDNIFGDDWWVEHDVAWELAAPVSLPEGAVLHFRHAYGFEWAAGVKSDGSGTEVPHVYNYDGGVLEYSVDDGAQWVDAGDLITHGGYNGTIADEYTNPLGGREGFVGHSRGHASTRVDLSSLAGEDVRLRFRLATDELGAGYGWYIDDVAVYPCDPDGSPQTTITEAPPALTASADARFAFTSPAEGATFACRLDEGDEEPCVSPLDLEGLADGEHTLTVTAVSDLGVPDSTPVTATFTVDTRAPQAAFTSLPVSPVAPARLEFAFTADEPAAFLCSFDGGPSEHCDSPHAYENVPAGGHIIRVWPVDAAGNAAPQPIEHAVSVQQPPSVGPTDPTEPTAPTAPTEPTDGTDPAPAPEPQPAPTAPQPAPEAPATHEDAGPAPLSGVLPRRPATLRLPATLGQITVNQRIAVAAIRRLNAINARLEGRPEPEASSRPPGRIVAGTAQLRINQRISEAAHRRAVTLFEHLGGTGATRLPSIARTIVFTPAGVGANQLTNIRTLDMLNLILAHLARE